MILMKASARAFASPVRYKNYIIGDESPAAGTPRRTLSDETSARLVGGSFIPGYTIYAET
jgi:hypothetical protein